MKCCLFKKNKKKSEKVFPENQKSVSPPIIPEKEILEINENHLALRVAEKEGGKKSISIAQIKEVQKIVLDELGREWENGNEEGVKALIVKHSPKED